MDINRWLEGTAINIPLAYQTPAHGLDPPSFPHAHGGAVEGPSRKRRKRKQPSSDSSLLKDDRPRRPPIWAARQGHNDHVPSQPTSSGQSSESESSSDEESAEDGYKRRPRHKTRPDLYDPKPDQKAKSTRKHRGEKRDSKKRKRKSKRKTQDKPGAGLMQTFHAKNVAISRLTMKPGENLGLFKKGRASSPVRGRGLPDLTFNEMKFLQKRRDPAEEQPPAEAPKKRRKKDQAHAKQDDISAYFAAKRPPLAERDTNIPSKSRPSHRGPIQKSAQDYEQHRSLSADPAISTIELPEKPYLGFGSRGTQPVSASYYSWSDSIRQPSVPLPATGHAEPRQPPFRHDIEPVQINRKAGAPGHNAHSQTGVGNDTSLVQPFEAARKATDKQRPARPQDLAQPEINTAVVDRSTRHVPPSHPFDRNHIPPRDAQNRSPRMPSSHKRNSRAAPRDQRRPHVLPTAQTESRSSVNIDALPELPRPQQTLRTRTEVNESSTENVEPESNSSLGRVLRECDDAVAIRRDQAAPLSQLEERTNEERMVPTAEMSSRATHSQGFPLRLPQQRAPMVTPDSSMYPNLYRRQHLDERQAETLPEGADIMGSMHHDQLDEEIYDDFVGGHEEQYAGLEESYNRYSEGQLAHATTDFDVSESAAYEQETVPDGQQEQDEGAAMFAGFWRPHRLY